SVGLAPLGVSAHSREPELRPHDEAEVVSVLDVVDTWQPRFVAALGRRMVFAADEYYVLADRPVPDAADYEGFPQHENGIGMARAFTEAVRAALADAATNPERAPDGRHKGFFAWVDGAPAAGYRSPRVSADTVSFVTRTDDRRPVAIVTGE